MTTFSLYELEANLLIETKQEEELQKQRELNNLDEYIPIPGFGWIKVSNQSSS